MDKKSVTQETAITGMSFLQVPGTEHESGNSRMSSATSSVKSGSIHFTTTVRMLAPVIWSRIQSRKKVCLYPRLKDCCCLITLQRTDVERPTFLFIIGLQDLTGSVHRYVLCQTRKTSPEDFQVQNKSFQRESSNSLILRLVLLKPDVVKLSLTPRQVFNIECFAVFVSAINSRVSLIYSDLL